MTETRTDREGYVWDGRTLIGKVAHVRDGWSAYQQGAGRLVMRYLGTFTYKRDAIAEVKIMREDGWRSER